MTPNELSETPPPIPAAHFQGFLASNVAIASIVSWLIIIQGANDEPYHDFHSKDALLQVGLGCSLSVIWLYVLFGILYGVRTKRLSKAWLFVIIWAIIVLGYLQVCPLGYVEDITKFGPTRLDSLP